MGLPLLVYLDLMPSSFNTKHEYILIKFDQQLIIKLCG